MSRKAATRGLSISTPDSSSTVSIGVETETTSEERVELQFPICTAAALLKQKQVRRE
jgi:hypothetical protein